MGRWSYSPQHRIGGADRFENRVSPFPLDGKDVRRGRRVGSRGRLADRILAVGGGFSLHGQIVDWTAGLVHHHAPEAVEPRRSPSRTSDAEGSEHGKDDIVADLTECRHQRHVGLVTSSCPRREECPVADAATSRAHTKVKLPATKTAPRARHRRRI